MRMRLSQTAAARAAAVAGLGSSAAAAALGIARVREASPVSCPPDAVCRGNAQTHPHAVLGVLLIAVAVLLAVATVRVVNRIGHCEPVTSALPALAGRHNPIDAVGVWYRDLPYWRRLAIALIALPLVAALWLAYQLRRGWFGPPD